MTDAAIFPNEERFAIGSGLNSGTNRLVLERHCTRFGRELKKTRWPSTRSDTSTCAATYYALRVKGRDDRGRKYGTYLVSERGTKTRQIHVGRLLACPHNNINPVENVWTNKSLRNSTCIRYVIQRCILRAYYDIIYVTRAHTRARASCSAGAPQLYRHCCCDIIGRVTDGLISI